MPNQYQFFSNLFASGWNGWKGPFFRQAQICFEKYYAPKGLWKQHPKNSKKYGHIDEKGNWHWSNRANTHPKFCMFIYNECIKENPNFFIDFGNYKYHEENAKRMWDFVYKNFEQYFEPNGINYKDVMRMFEDSWNNGNISMIAIIIALHNKFRNIVKIKYTLNYGNMDDMGGTDLTAISEDNKHKTFQVKSGGYLETNDFFIVTGTSNSLEYTTDYYAYANVNDFTELTQIIIFENLNLKKDGEQIIVPKNKVIYVKTENMNVPQLLRAIMKKCGKKDISFIMTQEGDKNSIKLNSEAKTIIVNIVDPLDKKFPNELKDFLQSLK